jgi:hypothetical protein
MRGTDGTLALLCMVDRGDTVPEQPEKLKAQAKEYEKLADAAVDLKNREGFKGWRVIWLRQGAIPPKDHRRGAGRARTLFRSHSFYRA